MNDRQLSSFILAADTGSFSKAAAAAYLSTPALQQQVKLLEADLGFKLFDRSSHGVRLTETGKGFYATAQQILELYEQGKAAGQEIAATEKKTLRVGCDVIEVPPFLIELCERFERENPGLNVQFVGSSYAQQIEELASGKFDLAFLPQLGSIEAHGLSFVPVYQDPYYCCVSPKDELATKGLIRLEDLDGQTLYLENLYRDEPQIVGLKEELERRGVKVVYDATPFSATLPLKMLAEGGVLPTPERFLQSCTPPLVAVPLDWEKASYGVASRKGPDELVGAFVDFARGFFDAGR